MRGSGKGGAGRRLLDCRRLNSTSNLERAASQGIKKGRSSNQRGPASGKKKTPEKDAHCHRKPKKNLFKKVLAF